MIKNRFLRLAKFIESRITKRQLVVLSVSFCVLLFSVLLCIFFLRKLPRPFNDQLSKTPENSNYLYQNIDNKFQVYLGSKDEKNKPVARFAIGPNRLVEFTAENVDAKEAKLEKGKILRYEQDNYDITYQIIEKGLKEEIILKQDTPGVEKGFSFIISYPEEMEIKETLPNQLTFYEKDGGYLFHFAKPFMEDKKGERSEEIKIKVRRVKEPGCPDHLRGGGIAAESGKGHLGGEDCDWLKYHLTFIPDQNWLTAEERQYPVILDPTIIHDTPSEFAEGTMNRIADSGSGQTPKIELPYHELPVDIHTAGLWHMNETADNSCSGGEDACDSSGNDNDGTATGTSIVDGKFGKARSFNGSSDYIDAGTNSVFENADNYTVEAWVKSTRTTGWQFIGGYYASSSDNGYALCIMSAGQFGLIEANGGSWAYAYSSQVYRGDNQWHHLAGVRRNGTAYLYVDGVEQPNTTTLTPTFSSPKVLIGRYLSDTYAFGGYVDEFRISNTALSPEEIAANASRRPYGVYTSKVIDFGQTPQSLNSLTWIDNVTPPTTPTNWTKVKPVLIDNTQNSSTLSNYQVKVHVDYDSNMQADFDDLKFTNSVGTNLDYWIEDKSDGVETEVWVEVDSIPANDWTTIFMFYGNGGASAASNGDNTFNFFDDFNDGVISTTKWPTGTRDTTGFTESGSYLNGTSTTGYLTGNVAFTGNYIQETLTRKTTDATNGYQNAGFWASTSNAFGSLIHGSNVWYVRTDSSWQGPWTYGTGWVRTKVVAIGTNSYIQHSGAISDYRAYSNGGLSSEYVRLGKRYDGDTYIGQAYNADWDWIFVRQYTSLEPTAAIGASIEFQTRTSADNSTWEAWKPTTSETQIESMDESMDEWQVNSYQNSSSTINKISGINNGDGADGAITVSANKNINTDNMIGDRSCADGGDAVAYADTTLENAGETSVTLSSTPSSGCLAAGDEFLIINLQGTSSNYNGVGQWETHTISLISTATLNFTDSPLRNTYDGTTQKIMVQRVPNYTDVTVNSTYTLTANAWDGTKGGVLFFRANGIVTASGTVSTNNLGYTNGNSYNTGNTLYGGGGGGGGGGYNGAVGCAGGTGGATGGTNGAQGSSDHTTHQGGTGGNGGGNGGSGGTGGTTPGSECGGSGGGGGGGSAYGGAGGVGGGAGGRGMCATCTNTGQNGGTLGTNPSDNTSVGSGGGGGGGYGSGGGGGYGGTAPSGCVAGSNGTTGTGGAGGSGSSGGCFAGNGGGGGGGGNTYGVADLSQLYFGSPGSNAVNLPGGVVAIFANTLTVDNSTGNITSNGGNYNDKSGASSGGSVLLKGNTLTLNTNRVTANGGTGGSSASDGGAGGSGRIALYYTSSLSGTTNPVAYTQKYDSTVKMEGAGSLKLTTGNPQVDSATVGLWHMEETSGTGAYIKDSSGNSNHGTPGGSPTVANGFFGKARSFNGSSDFILLPASSAFDVQNLTIEAWTYSLNYAHNGFVFEKTTNGSVNTQYSLFFSSANAIYFRTYNTTPTADDLAVNTTLAGVNNGQWNHIAATYDGSYKKIYVNGKEVASKAYSQTLQTNPAGTSIIGAYGSGTSYFFNGKLDEVRVSNAARTAEEIAEAYRAGRDHRLERTLSSTDLSAKTKIPFFVAADRPGTYLEAYVGETTNSVYGADSNTVGLWHLEEQDEAWGDTFRGTTIDTTKWTEIDPNNNKISQNNGLVLSAGALASWDSALISKRTFSRKTGNRIYASFTTGASVAIPNHMMIGWGQDQTADPSYAKITHALYFNYGNFYTYQDGVSGGDTGQDYTTSTTYEVLLDLGSDGKCRYYVKGGAFTNWTLLATDGTAKTNSPLRVHMAQYQHTGTFNEITAYPSVTAKDSSSAGNDGTTYGSRSTQGKIGKARNFNGTDDYVDVGSGNSLNITGEITVSAWVKPSSWGTYPAVYSRTSTNSGVTFERKNTGGFALWIGDGADWQESHTPSDLPTGSWSYIVGLYDGSQIKMYLNGVASGTPTSQSSPAGFSGSATIGRHNTETGAGRWFNGQIDELRVSKTARSATEIRQAYQQGLRTHQVTVDFVSSPQAAYTSGTSITINNPWGTTKLTDTLSVGDTIIVKENENGTEYIAQVEVTAITNTSSTYGTVTLKSAFSSIPPSGYTTNAKVFKWQREYWDLKDISEGDRNGTTKLGLRVTDGSKGFTFYLDDFRSNTNYLYLPFGNTISSTAQRYFQYRAIVTADGSPPSAPSMETNLTPQINRVTINYTLKDAEKDSRPVAYWKLDEGYGTTAYDETINGHDGVLNNMESTDWVAGYEGKALDFGGTNEYLSVANSADVNFGDHSMSISAFVNTSSSGATYTILDKYNSSSKGYKLYLNSTGKVVFKIGDGSNTPSVTSNKSVNDGLWHSILAVRAKGSTLRLYIDGLSDNTASDTANNIDSPADVVIGRDFIGVNYYIGKLDELNLYDYALSVPQAKVVYNKGFSAVLGATKTAGGADPKGFWKFDEASGSTANDSSGHGNSGSLGVGSSAPDWVTQGKIGNALEFDGNDYVDLTEISGDNNFTEEAWVWIDSSMGSGYRTIVQTRNGWILYDADNNQFELNIFADRNGGYSGPNVTQYLYRPVVNGIEDTWTHLAYTVFSNNTGKFYVNGVEANIGSRIDDIGGVTGDYQSAIGMRQTSTGWTSGTNFKGIIDHVTIYDYARTVAQIHHDMAGSPVGYWKLDEGYGTNAYDEIKNSNGTISGASWTNGKFGKALNFNGSASVTATISDPGYTNTLSLWLNPTTSVASKTLITASKLTTDASSRPVYGSCTGTALPLNQWTHLVAVSDGSGSCKIYQNGTQTASSTTGVTFGTSVNIGASSYTGLIDDVKVYNYALTANEIKVEYNQSSAVRLGNVVDVNDGGGDPVGFWKFDEASGTSANDSSGNGNTGSLGTGNSAPGWETNGKVGSALDFDGSNDYVNVPASSSLNFGASDPFTISLWIKTSNVNQNYGMFITRTTGVSEIRFYGTSGKVQTYWNSHCPRSSSCESTKVLSNNTWYHIALTYDQSTTSLYINGVLDVQGDYGGAQADTANLLIGKRSDGYNFLGKIDHVKIYNYARSVRQIALDYNSGKPVGYWKLDEKTGNTAWDESDHNYDGTLEYMNDADHVVGKFGWALDFDGSNDRVNMGNPSGLSFGTGDFSAMAWFKTTTTLGKTILDKHADPDGSGFPGYSLGTLGGASAGKAYGLIRDADSDLIYLASNRLVNDNQWHHAVIVRSGSSGYLYIDGVLEDSGTNAAVGSTNTSDPLRLGMNRPNDPLYFPGQIDDVRIYNYTRTAKEVKMDYNSGAVHFQ